MTMTGLTLRGEEEFIAWQGPVSALAEKVIQNGNRRCLYDFE